MFFKQGSNVTGTSIKSLKTFDVHWRTVKHVSFFVCIKYCSRLIVSNISVRCHLNTGQLFQGIGDTVGQCQWYMHIGHVLFGIPLE